MTTELTIGAELAGYRIETLLRRGGMSVVYLAEHLRLERKAVLKVLAPELAVDEAFRDRFVRESRIAAGLEHPHIVPIYEAGEAGGHLFIAMRYVRGTDLQSVIQEHGPLDPKRAVAIVRQVARALDAAHAEGLVHRDVKPANILLAPSTDPVVTDHAYLSDFGITKRVSYRGGTTTSGQVMGTVDYMAPEQIEGREIDGRADVYSLGCVLYQSLTGTVPFPRSNELAVLWAHVNERPPRVTAERTELPAAMDGVVAMAMAKDPARRYATAGALAEAAAETVGGVPEAPTAVDRTVLLGQRKPTPKRQGGRPVAVWGAVAAVVLAAAAVGIFLATRGGGGPAPQVITGPESVWRVDPQTDTARAVVGVRPKNPTDFAAGEGSLWITSPAGVTRITVDGLDATTIDVGGAPRAVAVGGGFPWVLVDAPGEPNSELVQVDPSTNGIGFKRLLPLHADALAVAPDAVWVLSSTTGNLLRFTPDTHKLVGNPIPVGINADGLAIGVKAVWVVNERESTLRRVDPATGIASEPMALPGPPAAIAAGEGRVWVVDRQEDAVIPVGPAGESYGPAIAVGDKPFDVTTGNFSVWVANRQSISRIRRGAHEAGSITVRGTVLGVAAEHTLNEFEDQREIWVLVANRS